MAWAVAINYTSINGKLMVVKYTSTRTSGVYGPLALAPAEGLEDLQAPCQVGLIYLRI